MKKSVVEVAQLTAEEIQATVRQNLQLVEEDKEQDNKWTKVDRQLKKVFVTYA